MSAILFLLLLLSAPMFLFGKGIQAALRSGDDELNDAYIADHYVQTAEQQERDESARLHRELLDAFDAEMGGYPLLLDNGTLIKNTPRKKGWLLGEARLSMPAYTPLQMLGGVGCRDYSTADFGMTDREQYEQMGQLEMQNMLANRQWQ